MFYEWSAHAALQTIRICKLAHAKLVCATGILSIPRPKKMILPLLNCQPLRNVTNLTQIFLSATAKNQFVLLKQKVIQEKETWFFLSCRIFDF